jgi:D-alanyl-D-alanine carboxypeptidase
MSYPKILTAMIARDLLGETFRFSTGFYTNEHADLAIKDFGDFFWFPMKSGSSPSTSKTAA